MSSAQAVRAEAVIAVEPTRDRIAGKPDHAATVSVQFADQRVIYIAEVNGQLFRATLRPQIARQRFRERGETRDVGEQCRAIGADREATGPLPGPVGDPSECREKASRARAARP